MAAMTDVSASTLTQQMMPTGEQIAGARRRLHRKAALIANLVGGSYAGLVFAPVHSWVRASSPAR